MFIYIVNKTAALFLVSLALPLGVALSSPHISSCGVGGGTGPRTGFPGPGTRLVGPRHHEPRCPIPCSPAPGHPWPSAESAAILQGGARGRAAAVNRVPRPSSREAPPVHKHPSVPFRRPLSRECSPNPVCPVGHRERRRGKSQLFVAER